MKQIIVAKSAGFCFGVKRAVEKVYEQVENNKGQAIYTFGPIIHNEEVVKDLEQKGVTVIETEEELKQLKEGIVIIRSHGVAKHIYEVLEENNITIVDATCPFVRKIHTIVEKESEDGREIIIIGNKKHPEVQGIIGWSKTPAIVIETLEAVEVLPVSHEKKVCIVSQTTFNYKKFQVLVENIEKKGYDINVVNTICNATQERQVEAKEIASQVDAMLVIGGKHSSNTQKLFEICKNECKNTYYLQTLKDLNPDWVKDKKTVGITAGASTPNNIIEEVQTNV